MAEPQRNERDAPEALIAYVQRSLILGITRGRFKSGERLSPSLIAKELGVSHIPVREALVALQAVGHVEHKPRIGFSIRPLSLEDLSDIYRLRKVLEEEALELSIPLLTKDDIAEMEDLCHQMGKLTHVRVRDKYLLLNRQFHFVP
ncbi:MAG: GntR family transcriptional regulator, partial [Geodermatophilaceae bacterium]|nr:GntR family transcriptional regulator [Geodermatophilaceae bacterium]